jgi:hypothetical protein
MNPAKLLADLRKAGAVVRLHGERLSIEAPAGVITAETRAQLARQKSELVSLLRATEPQADQLATEAIRGLAKLLATAYWRYLKVPRVRTSGAFELSSGGVALSGPSSVHGDGQPNAN